MRYLILLLALLVATPAAATDTKPAKPAKAAVKAVPTAARCAATTKKGTQCKRKAQAGSKYCAQHKNYKAAK